MKLSKEAVQQESALTALVRSLLLPAVLRLLFRKLLGFTSTFFALFVAEALTLALAFLLFRHEILGCVLSSPQAPGRPTLHAA